MTEARKQGMKAHMQRDKLYINGNVYTSDTIDRLPVSLHPKNLDMKIEKDCVMFWGKYAPLSNFFYREKMIEHEGATYSSSEQFYHAMKAKEFGDEKALHKIMSTVDPIVQKRVYIEGFKKDIWKDKCIGVMKVALKEKFTQNKDLGKILKSTENKLIMETSPHDKYWGIGMHMKSQNIHQMHLWGQNKMGELLMELRETI